MIRSALFVLVLCACFRGGFRGFRGSWEFGDGEKTDQANHRKSGINEIKKGLLSWKLARWCQAQAEDDQK